MVNKFQFSFVAKKTVARFASNKNHKERSPNKFLWSWVLLIDIALVNQLEVYLKLKWFTSYIFSLYNKEVQNEAMKLRKISIIIHKALSSNSLLAQSINTQNQKTKSNFNFFLIHKFFKKVISDAFTYILYPTKSGLQIFVIINLFRDLI